jgi:hypothetical protein
MGWDLPEVQTRFWGGLFLTIVISGIGIAFSLPAGVLLALGRRSNPDFSRAVGASGSRIGESSSATKPYSDAGEAPDADGV